MIPISFIAGASILFGLLAIIWQRDTLLNIGLKFVFLGFSIWGVVTLLRMSVLS